MMSTDSRVVLATLTERPRRTDEIATTCGMKPWYVSYLTHGLMLHAEPLAEPRPRRPLRGATWHITDAGRRALEAQHG